MIRSTVLLHAVLVVSSYAAPGVIDYDKQVYPFLKDNCIACHNKTTTKGGLNMETPELMIQGGESDKGLVPASSIRLPPTLGTVRCRPRETKLAR
jgi:hypothetical protein